MNWDQLLSTKRTGQEHRHDVTRHDRTQFQRDFDRLIFSSPFRRMQNKTQVFPLPGSVFVHNRLTHSLEVSSVGRSLGANVGRQLESNPAVTTELTREIGAVVASACLAHDMGNPPFGHNGEKAISHFFEHGAGQRFRAEVTDAQWNDLINFEGNANAFRLLVHSFNGRRKGGFALTYTTAASIVKYPYASGQTERKKYGFFQSEKEAYEKMADELGMMQIEKGVYARHPLVYLVEAADDICYQFMDIEDAHKLHILSTAETQSLFTAFFDPQDDDMMRRIQEVSKEVLDVNELIAFFRATVIGKLVDRCTEIFMTHQDTILNGTFHGPLIDHLGGHMGDAMKRCQQTAYKRIYKHPSVVEIEIAGFKILGDLLDEFTQAVINPRQYRSSLLLPFIPIQYSCADAAPVYDKIQSVLDFVSGMTDEYALSLYRKINGLGL